MFASFRRKGCLRSPSLLPTFSVCWEETSGVVHHANRRGVENSTHEGRKEEKGRIKATHKPSQCQNLLPSSPAKKNENVNGETFGGLHILGARHQWSFHIIYHVDACDHTLHLSYFYTICPLLTSFGGTFAHFWPPLANFRHFWTHCCHFLLLFDCSTFADFLLLCLILLLLTIWGTFAHFGHHLLLRNCFWSLFVTFG